jgi:hypothetical protein
MRGVPCSYWRGEGLYCTQLISISFFHCRSFQQYSSP